MNWLASPIAGHIFQFCNQDWDITALADFFFAGSFSS